MYVHVAFLLSYFIFSLLNFEIILYLSHFFPKENEDLNAKTSSLLSEKVCLRNLMK